MNDLFLDLSPSILEHSRVQGIHQEAMQLSRRSSVASSVAIRHISTRFPVVDTSCIFRVEFRDRVVGNRLFEKLGFVEQQENRGTLYTRFARDTFKNAKGFLKLVLQKWSSAFKY